MQLPKPNTCLICDKPVALEYANTDEFGKAVHEECYLLKLITPRDRDSVHKPSLIPMKDTISGNDFCPRTRK